MAFVSSSQEFLDLCSQLEPESTDAVPAGVFMVMPEAFAVDDESSVDNHYLDLSSGVDPGRALFQAEALADLIESLGIAVKRFPGIAGQTDGVFPNNVFATAPGRFIVGSMLHSGRREEARRRDIRDYFAARELHDLSQANLVAELTGPLIIDHARKIGFCGMSSRVDSAGALAMHDAFDLNCLFRFDLVEGEYHTNVVMSVLANRACVLHAGSIADPQVADAIGQAFPQRTLWLSDDEKNAFAANCIALTEKDLFMSQTGADVLSQPNRRLLESWGFKIHCAALDEIEKAGGSLRCMVAEIY